MGLDRRTRRPARATAATSAPREPARRPVDTSAEIATELGFDAALTLGELAHRWRDFVWRNHPDRQPLDARERANARVAIANTLYDGESSPSRDSRHPDGQINALKRQ